MNSLKKIGEVTIKGLAYEDVVSILVNNGYSVEVFTPSQVNVRHEYWKHVIRIYEQGELNE